MSDTTFDPSQYEQPFWEPIGQFVIQFGYLEMNVDWSMTALVQIHSRQGEAIASQIISLRSRIRLLEKLCQLITDDAGHRETMGEIVEEIVDLNTYRNRLLHGPWGSYHIPPSGEASWQKIYVGSQDFKYKNFSVILSELRTNTSRIVQVSSRLTNVVQEVLRARDSRDESSPSRDTQQ